MQGADNLPEELLRVKGPTFHGNDSDGRVNSDGSVIHWESQSLENPIQDTNVLSESRPDEFTRGVGSEPVDMVDSGHLKLTSRTVILETRNVEGATFLPGLFRLIQWVRYRPKLYPMNGRIAKGSCMIFFPKQRKFRSYDLLTVLGHYCTRHCLPRKSRKTVPCKPPEIVSAKMMVRGITIIVHRYDI